MFDIREAMLKSYRGKLEEYRKIIGSLPTETDERLANIILNPSNEREIAFCVSCLDFFNDITKTFKDITEEIAEILYKLNCLESSDFDGLIKTISDKTGNKFGDIKLSAVPFSIFPEYYELYSAYTALSTWMYNYSIQRIDRNNSDAHINRFMRMAEVFHEEYITAAYSTAIPASASIKHEESKVKQKKPQEKVASKPTDNK